jgi:hypothetical protein
LASYNIYKNYNSYKVKDRQLLVLMSDATMRFISGNLTNGNFLHPVLECETENLEIKKVFDRHNLIKQVGSTEGIEEVELFFDITMTYPVDRFCLGNKNNYRKKRLEEYLNDNDDN